LATPGYPSFRKFFQTFIITTLRNPPVALNVADHAALNESNGFSGRSGDGETV
jgi:hypothetical protein